MNPLFLWKNWVEIYIKICLNKKKEKGRKYG